MKIPVKRPANLAAFIACAGLLAYALYAQHRLLLEPCPLCVFQRLAVTGLGFWFLVAAIHDPSGWGRRVYAVLIGLTAALGSVVAGRHVWLQHLPADEVPACGPGFDYIMESFPLGEALAMIFKGSGECADINWVFLGLSMPAWVLIWIVGLGIFGVWNNLRAR
ncbi:MAG: disulfide bond formation protein B [Woeseia sp.]